MIPVAMEAGFGSAGAERAADRRCTSFPTPYRRAIEATAAQSPALADLADTFPALLFAIATGFGTRDGRDKAARLVVAGAPLRTAAYVLGLPFWMRRLPAEALTEPIGEFPASAEFALRIAALVPPDASATATWLKSLRIALECCHEPFALWTASWAAKHHRALSTAGGEQTLRWLAAWCWHADQRGTAGYRLLRRPWSAAIGYRRGLDELSVWRQRLTLAVVLDACRAAPYLADGHSLGYEFVLLRTAEDYVGEADLMDNCLDQFADRLMQGRSQVYAIRRNGRAVGDVEIGPHDQEPSVASIRQLRGPRNRRAAAEIWQAAYAWLGGQSLPPIQPQDCRLGDWRLSPARIRAAARVLWSPYLEHLDGTGRRVAAEAFRAMVLGSAGSGWLLGLAGEPMRRTRPARATGASAP